MTSTRGRYAADTSVSPEASRAEIERTLTRYGAKQFMYGQGEQPDGTVLAIVAFVAHERRVQFDLPLPDENEQRFLRTPTGKIRPRGSDAHRAAYQQEVRQRWRALALTIKALLEAVEVGLLTFEDAFLAKIMLPDGSAVGDQVRPRVAEAYATGGVPSLLPTYRPAIESS